ncbi:MAG: DNA polymerase III subunit gamma/tau [Patescibacteria group bacterium]
MTLYLKYRPRTIEELDLPEVRDQLEKIVASKDLPHAFLFSGPKGTGKTSAARVLAKIINCTGKNRPCNECEHCVSITKGNHVDVAEIDAASNRGIDDVRSLKESIILAPTSALKKVYIIDEVHMMTTEAFNAFLKTLEEPPSHVVFILATTDPQKLPGTVRSRLTAINFRKANNEDVKRQLLRVAKGEGVEIDDESILLISKSSDGSFRDAVKIFEQLVVMSGKKINKADVEKILLLDKLEGLKDAYGIIKNKNQTEIIELVGKYISGGANAKDLIDNLIEKSREDMLLSGSKDAVYLIELLMEARTRISHSPIPELPLEIALIKYSSDTQVKAPEVKAAEEEKTVDLKTNPTLEVVKEVKIHANTLDEDTWKKIMVYVKSRNTSVEALLRASEPLGFDGQSLTLGVFYKFHKERLEVAQNRRALEDVVAEVFGGPVRINYTLTEKKPVPVINKEPAVAVQSGLTESSDKDIIEAAKEIFGN